MVWWLMERVCRRLWALYPPIMDFLKYPHVDPVEVAMALNPSRMPNWGRFVTYSVWLQGYVPRLVNPDSFRVFTFCTDVGSETMVKRRKRPKKAKTKQDLLSTNTDPRAPGALGGLRRFARAQRLSQAQARDALRKSLAFKMAPAMVLNID